MDNDLRRLLAEQSAVIAEIRENSRLIYKHVRWWRLWNIVKIALIVVPIVASFLYLPPIIQKLISLYKTIP